jgi:membrane-bound lytic murein transglycosylase B
MDMNIKNLRNQFKGSKEDLLELEEKIYARSNKKAEWALDQIIALEKIDANLHLEALELKGSWAGAFGISQFIPTSYLSWAVDGNGDGVVNLFNLPDAVFSVANYLKSNGWGNADNEQRNAVFHYNNSSAYVDAVLKLASLIKPVEVEHEVIEKISPVETKMQAQSGGDPK